ncbi:hypothetical protein [Mycobacterium malmoense]|uniref:hypothetical protein n=1 Tax=Mycobacterium malmoense TaxID=1780 RepID=UPI00114D4AC1|nr:hypothetical protein [Mycobacterium malmoense]
MDLAARPHITAAAAVASAAVLAAGPMAQHLPNLHLAQHLPTVSVSTIQLTDASSALDLFSGVESELASLASGAAATAVPASLASAAFNPTQNLIVQTWLNTFNATGANLQTMFNTWSKLPFPLLRQVGANWAEYANLYVSSFQKAAAGAVSYFTGGGKYPQFDFVPLLQQAWSALLAGNFTNANGVFTLLEEAFWTEPFTQILAPLEATLKIPVDITGNLYQAASYLDTTGLTLFGLGVLLNPPKYVAYALDNSFAAVYSDYTAGNLLGAVTNLLNTPGAVVNQFLNRNGTGLLSSTGVLSSLSSIGNGVVKSIVAPGAQPILSGGGLGSAFQSLVNQLIGGWPSLTPVINTITGSLTSQLQSLPSVLSNLPSIVNNSGAWLASNIGFFITSLLKLL